MVWVCTHTCMDSAVKSMYISEGQILEDSGQGVRVQRHLGKGKELKLQRGKKEFWHEWQ